MDSGKGAAMPKMRLGEVGEKNVWEKLVMSFPEGNFLQSWNWGEFHKSLGKKVWRVGLWRGGRLEGGAEAVLETAKRGKYLAIYGGPLIDYKNDVCMEAMVYYLKDLARKEKCDFVRMRLQENDEKWLREALMKLGWRLAPMHLTADLTLRLDLDKPDETLLREMRKSTRYEIRRVEKEKVRVELSSNANDLEQFYQQQLILAQRHGFVPFNYLFLKLQFLAFVADGQALLFHSYKDDVLLASAMIIFYHTEAVYHYGVSTDANHNMPGTHAVLWEAIQEAKRRKMRRFNFWGIAPEGDRRHRFAGVSNFKRGFGGEIIKYVPTGDMPISWRYEAIRIFELWRKKRRRL